MANGTSASRVPLLFWLLILAGAVLRLPHLNGALEYDEIWTLEHYGKAPVSEIFANISLPNNHPLNSLWVKLAYVKDWHFTIRLASFLSGIGGIAFAGFAARQLAGPKAMLTAMLFCVIAPDLIAYSQTARGYSMQLFLLLVFANLVLLIGKQSVKLVLPGLLASGFLAVLALPTSVLYLLPLSLYALYLVSCLADKRERLIYLAGMAVFAAGSGGWYFIQWENLKAAQTWSIAINTLGDCVDWLVLVLTATGGVLLFAALLSSPRNRAIWSLTALAVFPLAAAVLTKAGPPRAYLMLTVIAAIAAAIAIEQSRGVRRYFLLAAAVIIIAASKFTNVWGHTDWHQIYRQIAQLPPEVMVVTDANDCYPLLWNNREYLNNSGQRLKAPKSLLILNETQTVEGVNKRGETVIYPVAAPDKTLLIGRTHAAKMALTELPDGNLAPGALGLVTVYGAPDNVFTGIVGMLNLEESLIKVNPWLTYEARQNNVVFRFLAVIVKADDKTPLLLQKVVQLSHPYVKVYQIGL